MIRRYSLKGRRYSEANTRIAAPAMAPSRLRMPPTTIRYVTGAKGQLLEEHVPQGREALTPYASLQPEVSSFDAYVESIVERCRKIGEFGAPLIKENAKLLTHCNAGALATVDYGTALAPMRLAHDRGVSFFVWVDETRPRLQGSKLTAWELLNEGIDHAVIADNAAGHYFQRGEVDLVITGADRIVANGDFANKIGTYGKALLAKEHGVPFYVAAPLSTFDFSKKSGALIPIEERGEDEVTLIGAERLAPSGSRARNPAFDVTPARLVAGFITEVGILKADELKRVMSARLRAAASKPRAPLPVGRRGKTRR